MQSQRIITLVGGTGFVGRYVVKRLARAGYLVRVISRNPDKALHLKTAGTPAQIVLTYGDLSKPETLEGKLTGSYAVVNLVGIMFESGRQNFATIHAQGAEKLAKLAKAAGAEAFIHLSAIGVDRAMKSKYARTKATGEQAVLAAFPGATILRPGIIFGPEDGFYNKFAAMAVFSPFLPLIGGGKTRFQPVYVGDVAQAIFETIEDESVRGKIYELGGPSVYTFREILENILAIIDRKRLLLPVPFGLASLLGFFTELLPNPPLTRDQVRLLEVDNVVGEEAKTLADLGVSPTGAEIVVPEYLSRFRKPVHNPSVA